MHDVLVVGAGPVGLHLGVLLLRAGLDVRILERRVERSGHSRAIGIHPPGLAALDAAGVAAELAAEGVHIRAGEARSRGARVGGLSFDGLSFDGPAARGPAARFPFILALEQERTEAALEAAVQRLDPAALLRGVCVHSLYDAGTHVELQSGRDGRVPSETGGGSPTDGGELLRARLVVGADGARSTVRRLLDVPVHGRDHPDSYLMGDFPDAGGDGETAVLFLEPGGIVESFPLPHERRRWVAHTDTLMDQASAEDLAALIAGRTGERADPAANTMLSAFGVHTRMAARMVSGRAVLIGDAAHEISPIGGQGMNLGFLDAAALAPIIAAALRGESVDEALRRFEAARMAAARRAARQAALNMALGRPLPPSFLSLRNSVLGALVRVPAVGTFTARRFSMQSPAEMSDNHLPRR